MQKKQKKSALFGDILHDLPEDRREIAELLLRKAKFIVGLLDDLEKIIEERGPVEEYAQGQNVITRENPAVRQYVQAMRSLRDIVSQILQLSGRKGRTEERDALVEFLRASAAGGGGDGQGDN
ncbi:MAG: hypothetical protein IMX05_01430 [Hydrogenibacillus schlegelii]|nr:hypothetical protein [Hydrogenibacillus schlegelii]